MSLINDDFLKDRNINIRKEFAMLQKTTYVNILYIRRSKYIKCTCYNPLHKVGNPTCLKCLGSGYVNAIEFKKINCSQYRYNFNGFEKEAFGDIKHDDLVFEFDYRSIPKTSDLICFAKYNSKNIPISISSVYEIQNPAPIRGDNGRIEYFESTVRIRTDKLQIVNDLLKTLSPKVRIDIMKGKRYIC